MKTISTKSHPCAGLDRPRGLQEVEAPGFFRQSVHKCGKVISTQTWKSGLSGCEMDPSGLDVSQAAKYCERNNEFLGSMKFGDLLII